MLLPLQSCSLAKYVALCVALPAALRTMAALRSLQSLKLTNCALNPAGLNYFIVLQHLTSLQFTFKGPATAPNLELLLAPLKKLRQLHKLSIHVAAAHGSLPLAAVTTFSLFLSAMPVLDECAVSNGPCAALDETASSSAGQGEAIKWVRSIGGQQARLDLASMVGAGSAVYEDSSSDDDTPPGYVVPEPQSLPAMTPSQLQSRMRDHVLSLTEGLLGPDGLLGRLPTSQRGDGAPAATAGQARATASPRSRRQEMREQLYRYHRAGRLDDFHMQYLQHQLETSQIHTSLAAGSRHNRPLATQSAAAPDATSEVRPWYARWRGPAAGVASELRGRHLHPDRPDASPPPRMCSEAGRSNSSSPYNALSSCMKRTLAPDRLFGAAPDDVGMDDGMDASDGGPANGPRTRARRGMLAPWTDATPPPHSAGPPGGDTGTPGGSSQVLGGNRARGNSLLGGYGGGVGGGSAAGSFGMTPTGMGGLEAAGMLEYISPGLTQLPSLTLPPMLGDPLLGMDIDLPNMGIAALRPLGLLHTDANLMDSIMMSAHPRASSAIPAAAAAPRAGAATTDMQHHAAERPSSQAANNNAAIAAAMAADATGLTSREPRTAHGAEAAGSRSAAAAASRRLLSSRLDDRFSRAARGIARASRSLYNDTDSDDEWDFNDDAVMRRHDRRRALLRDMPLRIRRSGGQGPSFAAIGHQHNPQTTADGAMAYHDGDVDDGNELYHSIDDSDDSDDIDLAGLGLPPAQRSTASPAVPPTAILGLRRRRSAGSTPPVPRRPRSEATTSSGRQQLPADNTPPGMLILSCGSGLKALLDPPANSRAAVASAEQHHHNVLPVSSSSGVPADGNGTTRDRQSAVDAHDAYMIDMQPYQRQEQCIPILTPPGFMKELRAATDRVGGGAAGVARYGDTLQQQLEAALAEMGSSNSGASDASGLPGAACQHQQQQQSHVMSTHPVDNSVHGATVSSAADGADISPDAAALSGAVAAASGQAAAASDPVQQAADAPAGPPFMPSAITSVAIDSTSQAGAAATTAVTASALVPDVSKARVRSITHQAATAHKEGWLVRVLQLSAVAGPTELQRRLRGVLQGSSATALQELTVGCKAGDALSARGSAQYLSELVMQLRGLSKLSLLGMDMVDGADEGLSLWRMLGKLKSG